MISAFLGLILFIVIVRLVIGILVRPGLLLRIVLGFGLLVLASIVALVLTVGQFVSRHGPHIGVSMPGVTVNPTGVHVYSGAGESVKVTPFGVEINSRTSRRSEGIGVDTATGPATVTAEAERPTSAEFRRVFEHHLESPSPASVAIESTVQAAPALPAEALSQVVPVQAEAPEGSAGQAPGAPPQRLLSDHFDPDVYQSEGAAIRGLTNQIVKVLDSVTYAREEPKTITIQGKLDQSQVVEMMDILAKAFPSTNVNTVRPKEPNAEAVIVYVSKEPRGDAAGKAGGADQVLRIDVKGSEGEITRSAPFLDKPWVDNFDGFWSRNPNHNWIMALSRNPATSAEEAEQQAIDDAIRQIEPRVRERMSQDAQGSISWLLQRQIRSELQGSGLIVDRFVQRFERPYGQIWQVALLIDAVPKKVSSVADKCDRVLAVQQRTFRQTVVSVAGLIALVCLVYIFLNSMTKGYFVWSLRAAALAIIAGGVFLVLLLSHNEPAIEGFLR